MPTPRDLAIQQQVYLERLKAGYVRKWDAIQPELERRIKAVLFSLEVDNMRDVSRRRLEATLERLREAHLTVSAQAMMGFGDELPAIAEASAQMEAGGLASLASNSPKFNIPTAKIAYRAAVDNPLAATGTMLEGFVRDWPAKDAMRVSNIVRKGWANGVPLMDMVRQFTGSNNSRIKSGELATTRRHAKTVIHTATQHVANAARMETWERNADLVTSYKWVSTLDSKTSPVCRSLDGREFEAGKGIIPPAHPNCRSTTVAVLSDKFKFLSAGRTRSSGGENPGYVDGGETYYGWLKKQSPEFQIDALGKQRAKLFQNGGLSAEEFAKLNLGRDFEPLSLAEMKALKPEVFKKAGM